MSIMEIFENISKFSSKNWIWFIIVLTIIQITPIKLNPWGALIKWIGGLFNSSLTKELGMVKKNVNRLQDTVDNLSHTVNENNAINSRVRILCFADDIRHGAEKSKESFDQCLCDITNYEQYCADHPKFKNEIAVMAIKEIKNTYSKEFFE